MNISVNILFKILFWPLYCIPAVLHNNYVQSARTFVLGGWEGGYGCDQGVIIS